MLNSGLRIKDTKTNKSKTKIITQIYPEPLAPVSQTLPTFGGGLCLCLPSGALLYTSGK